LLSKGIGEKTREDAKEGLGEEAWIDKESERRKERGR